MSRIATRVGVTALLACFACNASTELPPDALPHDVTGEEPIVGRPSELAEGIFQGLPEEMAWRARIAPEDEPGEPLRITGRVLHEDGTPAPGVIVYAYQTNDDGIYPPNEAWKGHAAYRHGTLRGWVRADEEGRYRFDTIRPGGYPDSGIAEHVHMHVLEPGRCTYYVNSIHFDDDPRLDEGQREDLRDARGGPALCTPRRNDEGVWVVERDVILGRHVPGYPERDA